MDGYYGSRGLGTGGNQPRNIREQVDAIMLRLADGQEPEAAPGDDVSRDYMPAPPPRNWRDTADAIVAQLEREQAERASAGTQIADSSNSGFGLISQAQAQVAIPLPPPPISGMPQSPDMGRQLIDFLAAMAADAQRKLGEANDAIRRRDDYTFQSYTKKNLDTPKTYVGRTGNVFYPRANVYLRDQAGYPEGNYDKARLDCSSDSYGAIRGREQVLIDFFRSQMLSDNQINGISALNPLRGYYMQKALEECGYISMPGLENR